MSDDDLAQALDQETPEVVSLRERVFRLERELMVARSRLVDMKVKDELILKLEKELGVATKLNYRSQPPKWLTSRPKSTKKHHGTPWLLLSDLHLDEVVEPAEVLGVNAYNREIAEVRLKTTFENAVRVVRDHWSGINYDGFVCALGGDIFSGSIHEELKETNEDTMLGSLDHWIEHIGAGITLLAEEFGKVHVPVVVGNHGRTTRKPRAKQRARDNFDWFLGKALARAFDKDNRVTFDVSESPDCLTESYDQKIMLTHGDQVTGGAGIGGIWPPIMRLDARKRQRNSAVNLPYDLLIMGHWHQIVFGQGFIVNGSLKGYDEYAFTQNFGFEEPTQALWLMTPEHGRTWTAPVYSGDREVEGW